MTLALILQSLSVLAAASALVASAVIAVGNRRAGLRQARLMFELDAAVRLAENLKRGGTPDIKDSPKLTTLLERQRLGGEASAMAGALGPERLPTYWPRLFRSEDFLVGERDDPTTPEWFQEAIEAQLAIIAIRLDIAIEQARGRERRRLRRDRDARRRRAE